MTFDQNLSVSMSISIFVKSYWLSLHLSLSPFIIHPSLHPSLTVPVKPGRKAAEPSTTHTQQGPISLTMASARQYIQLIN